MARKLAECLFSYPIMDGVMGLPLQVKSTLHCEQSCMTEMHLYHCSVRVLHTWRHSWHANEIHEARLYINQPESLVSNYFSSSTVGKIKKIKKKKEEKNSWYMSFNQLSTQVSILCLINRWFNESRFSCEDAYKYTQRKKQTDLGESWV